VIWVRGRNTSKLTFMGISFRHEETRGKRKLGEISLLLPCTL